MLKLNSCLFLTIGNQDEKNVRMDIGRQAFRANEFYDALADWELDFVSRSDKARTLVTKGSELETVKTMFEKYTILAREYYD